MTVNSTPNTAPTVSDSPTGADRMRGPLRYGDRVQLTDSKGRLQTITLTEKGQFHSHRGYIKHDDLVGVSEGTIVATTLGTEYQIQRPLLSDYVLSMPRGAAVVYPKDAAHIVGMADIFPGARVVEAGVGSGALTMSLLRAVGDQGLVHSFERRADFAEIASANIELFFGQKHPAWQLSLGDLSEVLPTVSEPGTFDRMVLDMLAPWENIDVAAHALAPGGVLICYVATATQLSRTAEDLRADGRFTEPEALETMVRGWHLEGLAVRPQHRMNGHTGFLIMARRLADGVTALERRRRPAKGSYPVEEEWTGEDLGERGISEKKLRRVVRDVTARVERTNDAAEPAAADATALGQDGAAQDATSATELN